MNELLDLIWKYLTIPLWLLQPSYPDPDAWIVLAFYQLLWIVVHVLIAVGILYHFANKE